MNKKGIELSANFMVMIIIAIIVFGLGVGIVSQIFQKAEDLNDRLSGENKAQLRNLLTNSESKIVVYPYNANWDSNGVVVGLGIKNTLGSEKDFNIKPLECIVVEGSGNCSVFTNNTSYTGDITIKNLESVQEIIVVESNSHPASGKYGFKISVEVDNAAYGKAVMFFITVP